MSKKRKTRREKQLSEMRKKLYVLQQNENPQKPTLEYSFSTKINSQTEEKHFAHYQDTKSYTYVLSDAQKTSIITTILLVINSIIYILIDKHIIPIQF